MLISSEQLIADFFAASLGFGILPTPGVSGNAFNDLELSVSFSESLLHFSTPCTFLVKRCSC